MSNLVRVQTDLLAAPPGQWVAELGRWEHLLADASRVQAAEVLDRARLVREVWKIRKLAAAIGVAASRVEALALRWLGQFGGNALDAMTPGTRSVARYLAELPSEQFADLLDEITVKTAVATLVSRRRAIESQQAEETEVHERAARARWKRADHAVTAMDIRNATRALIHELFTEGHPTTVAIGATKLLALLNIAQDDVNSKAAEAIVEKALEVYTVHPDNEPGAELVGLRPVPPFIMLNTDDGWVRISQQLATVEQLRWMANYRQERADDMARAAQALALYADRCEAICRTNDLPLDTPLGAASFAATEGAHQARYRDVDQAEATRAALGRYEPSRDQSGTSAQ